ncbi:MAG: hypothetical protein H6838_09685 [Planctomycetes bacterium]|nr:hypothetical protein [Planctomycetota bacterium]MCB9885753.1 hypothetical protein [Planctomycetota bacterium]
MIDPLWFTGFLLTLAIEVPLVAAFAPRDQRRHTAGIAAAVQLLTHPLAWLAVTTGALDWWTIEVLVVLVEGAAYALAVGRPLRAFGVSLLANTVSAAAGLLVLAR